MHLFDKAVCADVVAQKPLYRQDKRIPRDVVQERIVRAIQNEHSGAVPGGNPGRQTAAERAPVEYDLLLLVLRCQPPIHLLQIAEQNLLCAVACAFAKAPKVEDEKIKTLSHEIFGEFAPAFNTSGIAFDIEHHALAVGHPEVQGIHHAAILHVKIDLREREGVLVSEPLGQPLRAKEKQILPKVEYCAQRSVGHAHSR